MKKVFVIVLLGLIVVGVLLAISNKVAVARYSSVQNEIVAKLFIA